MESSCRALGWEGARRSGMLPYAGGMHAGNETSLLFSFGTLTLEAVQWQLFGAQVLGEAAVLAGHDVVEVQILAPDVVGLSGSAVHRGLSRREGASVQGKVLELTAEQLAAADADEVDAYVRRRVRLTDGRGAWTPGAAGPRCWGSGTSARMRPDVGSSSWPCPEPRWRRRCSGLLQRSGPAVRTPC